MNDSHDPRDVAAVPAQPAELVREYGPFDGDVGGVSFDGRRVWAAIGPRMLAFDPASGETERLLEHAADAGTAFDGTHLYQLAEARIDKIDPATGAVVHSIPAPGQGRDSGMAWADGSLWVGEYRERRIHQVDPQSGRILRSLDSNRFVTGVTWVDHQLWHGVWEGEGEDRHFVEFPKNVQVSCCGNSVSPYGNMPTTRSELLLPTSKFRKVIRLCILP